jgi:hypothetical protein
MMTVEVFSGRANDNNRTAGRRDVFERDAAHSRILFNLPRPEARARKVSVLRGRLGKYADGNLYADLRYLEEAGCIERVGSGRYRLTKAGVAAAPKLRCA